MARDAGVKRFVHSSSCIIYVPNTPYYVAKQAAEEYTRVFNELYGFSTIALRYSNVYGKRQSEDGISPNVFAALRKSKKENGKLFITGNGEQTRDYTHVSDVVEANILASKSEITGAYYVGTSVATSLNEVAPFFECPIEYIAERQGDIKHLVRDGKEFKEKLGWQPKVSITDGIADVL
jgi:UDP-glucose 4-epimerase